MSTATPLQVQDLENYIQGAWRRSTATNFVEVTNPATAELLARTPLSTAADVDAAVQSAAAAFPAWRRTPPGERIQYLFKLKNLLDDHIDEIARLITMENGKTLGEAKAELRRGIENVEVACGIPMMMQGYNLEDVTRGVDEIMIRQPLGVVAAIVPFNFPAMIAFWFLPYAIACGNTFVLKPSERVPLTMKRIFELLEKTGLPKGVVNLVNGGREAVDALLRSPASTGHQFCRLDARRETRLHSRRGERKAHAVPGRREESRRRVAGRRHGTGDANHQRQRVRLRRATLPGGLGGRDDRRSAEDFPRIHQRNAASTIESWQRARIRRADGPGDQQRKQTAHRIADCRWRLRRRQARRRRPQREGRRTTKRGNFVKPTVLDGLPATSEVAQHRDFGPVLSLMHANIDR